jgi:hypothetical protein
MNEEVHALAEAEVLQRAALRPDDGQHRVPVEGCLADGADHLEVLHELRQRLIRFRHNREALRVEVR